MINSKWFVAAAITVMVLAIISGWLWFRLSAPRVARDFEECAERAAAASVAQRATLLTDCVARFAGRRKPGGGYSYYDFMQDRSFDIAGPNPTVDERKQIDREYMKYLDSMRRDVLSAELAQQQNGSSPNFQQRWQEEMLRREAEELQRQMEQLARNQQQNQQGNQQGVAPKTV